MQTAPHTAPCPAAPDVASRLTDGETAVLMLMAQGHSNAGIATVLGLSHRTVECHASRIFDKLSLPAVGNSWNRRVLAARWWWRSGPANGLGAPGDPPVLDTATAQGLLEERRLG